MKCEEAGLICGTHHIAYINLIMNILTFINELEADLISLFFMGIIYFHSKLTQESNFV